MKEYITFVSEAKGRRAQRECVQLTRKESCVSGFDSRLGGKTGGKVNWIDHRKLRVRIPPPWLTF